MFNECILVDQFGKLIGLDKDEVFFGFLVLSSACSCGVTSLSLEDIAKLDEH